MSQSRNNVIFLDNYTIYFEMKCMTFVLSNN